MTIRQRLWLCLPAVALCALDLGLTLPGQPGAYWDGDRAAAVERNPLAAVFLRHHPASFVVSVLAWAGAFTLALSLLPLRLALVTAFAVALGHAVGGASWMIAFFGSAGWLGAVGLLWRAERLARSCWRHASRAGGEAAKAGL
jgi:hypothetical protein